MTSILIVDDHHVFAEGLAEGLTRRGYDVRCAFSGREGLAAVVERPPRVVLLDLRLTDVSGIDLVAQIRRSAPQADVVIVTAYPELPSAIAAIRERASDYLTKPISLGGVEAVIQRVLTEPSACASQVAGSRRAPAAGIEMIGASPAMAERRHLLRQFAASGVRAVLITGESGTGKEVAARLFHAECSRRDGPFVEVNCAAVSEALFESEFFGHERGAFTGAVAQRRGLVEVADGGTLFLDEVGEIPMSCQPKLLRFLDDQTFLRVGGRRKASVSVQVVAATNRDLGVMVAQGGFRQDLYFRLNVAPVVLPPLRERPEDILPLAAHWLEQSNARYGKGIAGFAPEAEDLLLAYAWPGNVRELRNLVERLVILAPGERITAAELPVEHQARVPAPSVEGAPCDLSLTQFERIHIRRVLARAGGNKTKAAGILGIDRHTLRTKLGSA